MTLTLPLVTLTLPLVFLPTRRGQREIFAQNKPSPKPELDPDERAARRLRRCYTPAFMSNVLVNEAKRAAGQRPVLTRTLPLKHRSLTAGGHARAIHVALEFS